VILTDPIFKGMAISLAFGVMVSTVLTLIVIPLGCISAADSLRELAGLGGAGIAPATPATPAAPPREAPTPRARPRPEWARLRVKATRTLSRLWALLGGLARRAPGVLQGLRRDAARPGAAGAVPPQPTTEPSPAAAARPAGKRPVPSVPEAPAAPAREAPEGGEALASAGPPPATPVRPTATRPASRGTRRAGPAEEPGQQARVEGRTGTVTPIGAREERAAPGGDGRPAAEPDAPPTPATPARPEPASVTDIASAQANLRRPGGTRKRRGIRLKPDMPGLDEPTGSDEG
jgi:hypothetical protein